MKVFLVSLGLLLAFGVFASITLSGCGSLDAEFLLLTGSKLGTLP
ncbi:MAG: hypothetical protein H6Q61_475 [Firmicutes bacterium]|nr:hypothetical protein [Bacillota bacterium]